MANKKPKFLDFYGKATYKGFSNFNISFCEMRWNRPFDYKNVVNALQALANAPNRFPIVFEIRGSGGQVSYLLGADPTELSRFRQLLSVQGEIAFGEMFKSRNAKGTAITTKSGNDIRQPVSLARKLLTTSKALPLKTSNPENLTRSVLANFAQTKENETLALQLVLGRKFAPISTPKEILNMNQGWWSVIFGLPQSASSEMRNAVADKQATSRFATSLRIGASATLENRTQSLLRGLFASLRLLETPHNHFYTKDENPERLNAVNLPLRYSHRLSVDEVAHLLVLPVGNEHYLGVPPLHPKLLSPPDWFKLPNKETRSFGTTLDGKTLLRFPVRNNLTHLSITSPTGTGKTVAMQHLILDDINKNLGGVVIDPKSDLIKSLLERIPEHRLKDVVILDPTSLQVVGINPFASLSDTPELITESVLNSLHALIPDFGIYTEEYLTAGLLTLAKSRGSTLLHLPLLFTNKAFRNKLVKPLDDLYLTTFWQNFEKLSERERNRQLAPLTRRLNVLLMRQSLVGVLGQSAPKFNLNEVFTKQKILLIPLNTGLIGETSAELIASLVIGQLWDLAKKRATLNIRPPVIAYIDEVQRYIKMSASDFEQMVSQGRSLGLGLVIAHQNLAQISKEIKAAIFANMKSKLVFQLSRDDAIEFARLTPKLEDIDFMSLPRYQCYTILESDQGSTGWISGKTFPPEPKQREAVGVYAASAKNYGIDLNAIKTEIFNLISKSETEILDDDSLKPQLSKRHNKMNFDSKVDSGFSPSQGRKRRDGL